MPAADRVFVDTNVLVYGQLRDCALFDTVGRRLAQLNSAGSEFWISRQVLREYLAVMSREQNLTAALPMTELLSDVQFFCDRYRVAEDGPFVTEHQDTGRRAVRWQTNPRCEYRRHDACQRCEAATYL